LVGFVGCNGSNDGSRAATTTAPAVWSDEQIAAFLADCDITVREPSTE